MNAIRHKQRGAALVVGLVLLLILTLLAISGMNTATTELTMAGNAQYQVRAFQAAETGIEDIIAARNFNPAVNQARTSLTLPNPDPNLADDQYATVTRPRGNTMAPPGFSIGEFTSEHFEIVSTGASQRNASATHTQGLFLVVPNP